jgi:hypothetical protein
MAEEPNLIDVYFLPQLYESSPHRSLSLITATDSGENASERGT